MNDFSELENDLKALRPARPSPVLFERIEEAMAENYRTSAAANAVLDGCPQKRPTMVA